MTKKAIHSALFLLLCLQVFAQGDSNSVYLNFHPEFNKLPLEFGKQYISGNKDSLRITTFRCYISDVWIQFENQSVMVEKDSYHLLDLEKPESLSFPITQKSNKLITKVGFSIGIDSTTNNSGALNGDLDPSKGMYWAWQSGYINTKIEGSSPSCKTHQNKFEFHIGGYLEPYYAMREMEFVVDKPVNRDISIGIDLAAFFSKIKLSASNSVMIPGKEAMLMADISKKMFYLQ